MDYLLECIVDKSKQDFDIEIVKYGYKLLVSSIVGTLMVLMIAFFLFKIEDAIIFLISFSILRRHSGGYHCKTYVRCNFLLLLTYFGSVIWMKIEMYLIEYILVIMTLFHIVRFAPIKSANRVIDSNKIKKINCNALFSYYDKLLDIFYKISNRLFNCFNGIFNGWR